MTRNAAKRSITWEAALPGTRPRLRSTRNAWTRPPSLRSPGPGFSLIESLLYDGAYFLLEEHLERLLASAAYFGFPACEQTLREALEAHLPAITASRAKVRLLLDRHGKVTIESAPAPPPRRVRVGLARQSVSSGNVFLYHKTTHRTVYTEALASRPDCDDVILWNEKGEVTESTTANVVIERDGKKFTPPVECGLLGGTHRARLLARGELEEARLRVDDLERADSIHLLNSVRGWIDVEWIPDQLVR